MAIIVNEINRTLLHLPVSFKSTWRLLGLPDRLNQVSQKATVISWKIYHDITQKIGKLYDKTSYTGIIWLVFPLFFAS